MPMQRQGLPFDRLRWTEEDARNALKALHESGKSVSVFAAEHGIDPQRLYSWRRRLGGYVFSAGASANAKKSLSIGARVCL